MKKHLLLLSSLLLLGYSSKINAQSFEKGKLIISAGYGFPNLGKSTFKTYESNLGYTATGLGPIHGKFEYALSDKIGLGISLNYVQYKVEWTYTDLFTGTDYKEGFEGSSLSANARLNIHFATSEKLDPYWGIGIGYRSSNYEFYSDYPGATTLSISGLIPLGFETTVGLRYYLTPNIGLFAEAGISKSIMQGGLAFKL